MGEAARCAVKMHHVTKTFGKVIANKDINLELKNGEILALLGENGSGKTTLMNMLSGIYFPDHGEIYVKGEEVTIRSPKDSFALGIGMIHQHFKLVDVLTAAENIVLGLDGKAMLNRKEISRRVSELAKRYGIGSLHISGAGEGRSRRSEERSLFHRYYDVRDDHRAHTVRRRLYP